MHNGEKQMLLSYHRLLKLVRGGVIEGAKEEHVNGTSIDVTLGPTLWIEVGGRDSRSVDLAKKERVPMNRVEIPPHGYDLLPGQFVLAQTREVFNLPSIISAEFKLKSSGARDGLDNALATWCDPGWNGSVLTLELKNNLQFNRLVLREGMKIGQMIFWEADAVPTEQSYAARGQYNGDRSAQPSRGAR